MKTSQVDYMLFKQSFLYWQKELGCVDYHITFEWVNLNHQAATISINHEGKGATVAFATELGDDCASPETQLDPIRHGKHEALHLFLSRLACLAHSRYVLQRELLDAEEGMVRVLEKVLPDDPKRFI